MIFDPSNLCIRTENTSVMADNGEAYKYIALVFISVLSRFDGGRSFSELLA